MTRFVATEALVSSDPRRARESNPSGCKPLEIWRTSSSTHWQYPPKRLFAQNILWTATREMDCVLINICGTASIRKNNKEGRYPPTPSHKPPLPNRALRRRLVAVTSSLGGPTLQRLTGQPAKMFPQGATNQSGPAQFRSLSSFVGRVQKFLIDHD